MTHWFLGISHDKFWTFLQLVVWRTSLERIFEYSSEILPCLPRSLLRVVHRLVRCRWCRTSSELRTQFCWRRLTDTIVWWGASLKDRKQFTHCQGCFQQPIEALSLESCGSADHSKRQRVALLFHSYKHLCMYLYWPEATQVGSSDCCLAFPPLPGLFEWKHWQPSDVHMCTEVMKCIHRYLQLLFTR